MNINIIVNTKILVDSFSTKKLPTKLAYKLYKFSEALSNDYNFYNTKLREILGQYGEKDEKGQLIIENNQVKVKDTQECEKALKELNSIECDIPPFSFTIDELAPLELSISDIGVINNFIVEE